LSLFRARLTEDKFSAAKSNLLSIGERNWFVSDASISHKGTVARFRIDQLPSTPSTLDDRMLSGNGAIPYDHVVRFVVANRGLGFPQNELARPRVNRIDRQQATDRVFSES